MIKAVIIDLDETLSLTEAVAFEMENIVLVKMGRARMPRDIHKKTWGMPIAEAIVVRSPGTDVETFTRLHSLTIAQYVETSRLDNISDKNYEALDQLLKNGKTVMVLTSRTHGELRHLLKPDHVLASRVKTFYYRDNMQYHKPDPRAFTELLQDNQLTPDQCIYVGDSLNDALAAKNAGLHFVASLENGLLLKDDFRDIPVDIFINKFPEIVSAVSSIDSAIIAQ